MTTLCKCILILNSVISLNANTNPYTADLVRTAVKAGSFKQCHQSSWYTGVYTLTFINDNQYLIDDHRRRVWNRLELLTADDAHDKDS